MCQKTKKNVSWKGSYFKTIIGPNSRKRWVYNEARLGIERERKGSNGKGFESKATRGLYSKTYENLQGLEEQNWQI